MVCVFHSAGFEPDVDMSMSMMDHLLTQLRLLARVNVQCNAAGQWIHGTINREVEVMREELSALHDQFMDGFALNDSQLQFVQRCQSLVQANRPVVRQLEREFC